jgi:hypothetical protein
MILDMMALLIPQPSITLGGVEYTENVNVIRLSGEHEVTGNFGFIQMTPQDYEWLKRETVAEAEVAAVDAYTIDLITEGLL